MADFIRTIVHPVRRPPPADAPAPLSSGEGGNDPMIVAITNYLAVRILDDLDVPESKGLDQYEAMVDVACHALEHVVPKSLVGINAALSLILDEQSPGTDGEIYRHHLAMLANCRKALVSIGCHS